MGILNTTPDSFSDGGQLLQQGTVNLDAALKRAEAMVTAGAKILDVGGESTRPGAKVVSEQEELQRVVPLVEAIARELDVVISVDTSSAIVMTEAASVGAGLINDVRSLQREGALSAVAESGLPVCIMHMRGEPQTMQTQLAYESVVDEVLKFLLERAAVLEAAGIPNDKVLLDPGYGFSKSPEHNLQLLQKLPVIVDTGFPVLAGLSRKSVIGHVLNKTVEERLAGSLAAALLAAQAGAKIIRVHDVAETVDALKVWQAVVAA
ncbi:dihydropteroate synthase [Aestuariicella hydrocarbonica]|uniref:dihydropteroate synthase n=2 Tax=Pseudomaricurvus hydrocarbonicus TaxID=1470433 RepID=A0A9E5MLW3_9GAMM|nr:dihydropteroate synthase [Aestuariicella hydrocarbonica]NHO64820.1 dihydropteroate synthase [Aestuariicella hydrocarbonica]